MRSYPDAVRFLYSLGNEVKTAKLGLDAIGALLARLDHPERAFRVAHVAGTNGKGSTAAMIESGLRAAGVRTGLYTSPHLAEPTERIRLGGVPVSQDDFAAAFDAVHRAAGPDPHPTYFETVTAMAFLLFRQKGVETAVVEVGLGGRLDATNVVEPAVCVITPVDMDHEAFLGHTIEQVAAEKAGILKPGVPAVIARQHPAAEQVIQARAGALGCRLIHTQDYTPVHVELHAHGSQIEWPDLSLSCPLAGAHQVENATTAVLALRELGVSGEDIRKGIAEARWPGRLERAPGDREILLDGAHNPAGARALAAYIERFFAGRRVWMIFGAMRDKRVEEIAGILFPLASELILTAPGGERAMQPADLLALAKHPNVRTAPDVASALALARRQAAPQDVVFITGSLYVVGEARALLVQ